MLMMNYSIMHGTFMRIITTFTQQKAITSSFQVKKRLDAWRTSVFEQRRGNAMNRDDVWKWKEELGNRWQK